MNKKKLYLTASALFVFFAVLIIFYILFFTPINSQANIKVDWISSYFSQPDESDQQEEKNFVMPELSELNFPLEIDQRGPIFFNLYGEVELSDKKAPGLLIPAVQGAHVQVIFNGQLITDTVFPKDFDKPSQLLYSYIEQINPELLEDVNKVIIQYMGRDKLEIYTSPYFGDFISLRIQINAIKFLGQDFYLIIFGMGALLSVILISLGKHVATKKNSYVAMGIAMIFNALGSFLYILNSPDFFVFFSSDQLFTVLQPISYTLFIYFLVIGIESYYNSDSKNNISHKLLFPNITACFVIYLGFDIAQYIISYINLSFMVFLSFNRKTTEFIYPVSVLTASTIYLLIVQLIGVIIPFPVYALSSMIIIFSFGIIMVRDFQKTYQELQSTSNELYASYEELTAMNEELESSYNELDRKVEERTYELNKTTVALKTLLDNTEEGFLTFSESLIIDPEYSLQCETMFGKEISNRSISAILGNEKPETTEFLDKVFTKIMHEDRSYAVDMYISLLPETITLGTKTIQLNYKLIDTNSEDRKIMVILHDISEKVELQNEIENERNILKMVIKVLNSREDYLELIRDFSDFTMNGMEQICNSQLESEDKIAEIFRMIHTYKGSFANFDTINAVASLHDFETILNDKRKSLLKYTNNQLVDFFNSYDYNSWIRKDIDIIRGLLGSDFFSMEQKLSIDPERIYELENKIAESELGEEGREFLIELKRLRYTSFTELLSYYKNYTSQLAKRMGKFINPVIIDGEDIPVDRELYKSLIRSLTHLFRNSIYHGIENPEERVRKGKPEYGQIKVEVNKKGELIELIIHDDGRGINLNAVCNTAIEKGFVEKEQIEKMDESEKLKLILKDRLSTSKQVSDISGRGVGLSALKHELEKFQGEIEIQTKKDSGTTFKLIIPIKEAHEMPELPIKAILDMIKKEVDDFLDTQKIALSESNQEEFYDGIELYRYNALIRLSGSVYATVFLSAERKTAEIFASKLLMDIDTSTLSEKDISDGVCEQCNIFVGNAMREASKKEAVLSISSPVSLKCNDGCLNYPDKEKHIYSLQTEYGMMKFGVIEK
ncbi:MAG: ATP-binding protein [Thermotogota bacterium]|nr:ATP-binding protein [Thermotogota bacterium]